MKKKIIWIAGVLFGFLLVVFSTLILSSLNYDASNPRDRANSYYIHNSIEIDRPVSEVFHFIQYRLPEIYQELTDMHTEFTILNAQRLEKGAEIRCLEGDKHDIVYNHYIVTKVVANTLIQFESTPTIVCDRKTKTEMAQMNVYVYFDFAETDRGTTRLQQTIVIDMLNPFYKSLIDVLAFVTGNRGEWARQFRDELVNFKPIIERQ
ncbi:hypothetical protein [Sulfurimonas sp. HSL3-7]|uniref:hypothetical protein n=1 Tax=Sulfonitrofixus jiaomeiensis TaxID=3131938 RepID=UPI0031FA48FE